MPTILIVDDEALHCELASRCLQRIPALHTVFAHNGDDALLQIEKHCPDLVLTDLRMPGMSGLDLVRKIQEEYPFVPVILMTAYGSEKLAVRALTLGAASYVPKNDLAESLAGTVEQVMTVAQAKRRRELVFKYIGHTEASFDLDNNPELIAPLVGFLQNNLQRLGFGDESVRTRVGMALMEAVSNAMFHGNLEVSSALRKENMADYFSLVQQRRTQEPYSGRRIHITARESRDDVIYRIQDDGAGFDRSKVPDPTAPANILHLSGRGLLLIQTFMDKVEFNESGNGITMVKRNLPLSPLP